MYILTFNQDQSRFNSQPEALKWHFSYLSSLSLKMYVFPTLEFSTAELLLTDLIGAVYMSRAELCHENLSSTPKDHLN